MRDNRPKVAIFGQSRVLPDAFRSDPGAKQGGQSDGMARVTVKKSIIVAVARKG